MEMKNSFGVCGRVSKVGRLTSCREKLQWISSITIVM